MALGEIILRPISPSNDNPQAFPKVQLIGTASFILPIHRHECVLLEVVDPKTKLMIDDAIPLSVSQTKVPVSAREAAIEAVTPDDGLISGKLSMRPILRSVNAPFQFYYRSNFGTSFFFSYYGSWVRDKESNLLYGFIIKGLKDPTLYKLAPAKSVFEDTLRALSAKKRVRFA
ncbi:hypothetical protein V8C35DRAFT_314808 [Trichoderma chlorosporum]